MVLAPAMNTLMWDSPVTRRHLRQILEDRGDGRHGDGWTLDEAAEVFARHAPGLVLVPPQSKRLACGDVGPGAMAEVPAVAEVVRSALGLKSPGIVPADAARGGPPKGRPVPAPGSSGGCALDFGGARPHCCYESR